MSDTIDANRSMHTDSADRDRKVAPNAEAREGQETPGAEHNPYDDIEALIAGAVKELKRDGSASMPPVKPTDVAPAEAAIPVAPKAHEPEKAPQQTETADKADPISKPLTLNDKNRTKADSPTTGAQASSRARARRLSPLGFLRRGGSLLADFARSSEVEVPVRGDDIEGSIRKHLKLGGLAALLLVGGIGGWATLTYLSGAVIAGGQLVVESSVKTVQHPNGGIVGELNVSDGAKVKKGEILIKLDDTTTRASLSIVANTLDELDAAKARLLAERDGLETIEFPESLMDRAEDPRIAALMARERRLFALRREAREGQKAQLQERIVQLEEEVRGLKAQEEAKTEEIRIVETEVSGVRDLWEKKLVPLNRLSELERTMARLKGERGQLIAATSQARGRISETELQIIQLEQDLRSAVAEELAKIEAKAGEYRERRIAAQDTLQRIDIRAPQSGRVHQLAVHTIGGVISPGEPIMKIVPEDDALTVEAKVAPQDIDQLYLEQSATLRFSGLNQRTTPEVGGEIVRISPDLVEDKITGAVYYVVRIKPNETDLGGIGDIDLVPGMPVEAFIRTSDRTVLSYFLKPLSDQVNRAFREE